MTEVVTRYYGYKNSNTLKTIDTMFTESSENVEKRLYFISIPNGLAKFKKQSYYHSLRSYESSHVYYSTNFTTHTKYLIVFIRMEKQSLMIDK